MGKAVWALNDKWLTSIRSPFPPFAAFAAFASPTHVGHDEGFSREVGEGREGGGSGLEVLRRLRTAWPLPPFGAITPSASPTQVGQAGGFSREVGEGREGGVGRVWWFSSECGSSVPRIPGRSLRLLVLLFQVFAEAGEIGVVPA
jgi:hypothetical protein